VKDLAAAGARGCADHHRPKRRGGRVERSRRAIHSHPDGDFRSEARRTLPSEPKRFHSVRATWFLRSMLWGGTPSSFKAPCTLSQASRDAGLTAARAEAKGLRDLEKPRIGRGKAPRPQG
jgi:hypothetical protein